MPNLRGCEGGVLFVKDWREVSVCRRLCSQYAAAGLPRLTTVQRYYTLYVYYTKILMHKLLHIAMHICKTTTKHITQCSTQCKPVIQTAYYTMCSQYAGWPPLTPAISSVCHSAVTPSPHHSTLVGTFPIWSPQSFRPLIELFLG